MKKIRLVVLLLCATALCIGGYYNLIRLDYLEIRLYEISHLSWMVIPFVARLITAFCFFIPVLVLLTAGKPRIIGRFLAVVLLLTLLADQYFSNCQSCTEVELLNVSESAWLPGMVSVVALVLLLLVTWKYNYALSFRYHKAVVAGVMVIALISPYIVNPVLPGNFRITQNDVSSIDPTSLLSKYTSDDGIQLYCFYTTTCHYCRKNSERIYLTLPRELLNKVYVLFPGKEKEKVERFFQRTNTHFNCSMGAIDLFREYKINRFPSFIMVKDGKVIHSWTGGTFNYAVLNKLPELLSK